MRRTFLNVARLNGIRSNIIGVNALSAGVSRNKCAVASSESRSWRCKGHGKCTARAVDVHSRSLYPRRTVQGRRATCSDLRPFWHLSLDNKLFIVGDAADDGCGLLVEVVSTDPGSWAR